MELVVIYYSDGRSGSIRSMPSSFAQLDQDVKWLQRNGDHVLKVTGIDEVPRADRAARPKP